MVSGVNLGLERAPVNKIPDGHVCTREDSSGGQCAATCHADRRDGGRAGHHAREFGRNGGWQAVDKPSPRLSPPLSPLCPISARHG